MHVFQVNHRRGPGQIFERGNELGNQAIVRADTFAQAVQLYLEDAMKADYSPVQEGDELAVFYANSPISNILTYRVSLSLVANQV